MSFFFNVGGECRTLPNIGGKCRGGGGELSLGGGMLGVGVILWILLCMYSIFICKMLHMYMLQYI